MHFPIIIYSNLVHLSDTTIYERKNIIERSCNFLERAKQIQEPRTNGRTTEFVQHDHRLAIINRKCYIKHSRDVAIHGHDICKKEKTSQRNLFQRQKAQRVLCLQRRTI